jgi:phosphatidate cytidylyltransferase
MLTILACIAALITHQPAGIGLVIGLFLLVGVAETAQATSHKLHFFLHNTLLLLIAALYVGVPLGLLSLIRVQTDGLLWIMMLLLNNWATDAFALIGGRIIGRQKLAPTISPAKTVEGAAIGWLAGFVVGMTIALIGGVPLELALIANVGIPVMVEVGDLIESWAKRRLALKDSGQLLPGHGGILDRIDGTLLATLYLSLILAILG